MNLRGMQLQGGELESLYTAKPLTGAGCLVALTVAISILLRPVPALAGFISEPAFSFTDGTVTIGTNWLPPNPPLISSKLASIDDNNELQQLFGLGPDLWLGGVNPWPNRLLPVVDAFFVDAINFCPGEVYQPAVGKIVGCAMLPGNVIILDSALAASPAGFLAIGHELGHNAGLIHVNGVNTNLMNPIIGSSDLTQVQFNQIQNNLSALGVINIRPIAVVVPEPSTLHILLSALAAVFGCAFSASKNRKRVGGMRSGGGAKSALKIGVRVRTLNRFRSSHFV